MVKQRIIRASTLVKGCQHQVFSIIYREALLLACEQWKVKENICCPSVISECHLEAT